MKYYLENLKFLRIVNAIIIIIDTAALVSPVSSKVGLIVGESGADCKCQAYCLLPNHHRILSCGEAIYLEGFRIQCIRLLYYIGGIF